MAYLFPHRSLSLQEWRVVPQVFFQLLRAAYLVHWVPSRYWLPPTLGLDLEQNNAGVLADPAQIQQAERIALLIEGAARRLPWRSTCLIRALAGWQVLRQRGLNAHIRLGVQQHAETGLGAHAWLVLGEKTLLGGKEAPGFSEIAKMG